MNSASGRMNGCHAGIGRRGAGERDSVISRNPLVMTAGRMNSASGRMNGAHAGIGAGPWIFPCRWDDCRRVHRRDEFRVWEDDRRLCLDGRCLQMATYTLHRDCLVSLTRV